MRKTIALLGLAAVAIFALAQSGAGLLSSFAKTMNGAQTLDVTYTIQRIGGISEEYTISYEKPNMVRLNKAGELIVADGKTITTYDKVAKTYYKKPQTEGDLKALLSNDEYGLWQSFFDANVYAKTPSKSLGTKNRKGMVLNAVELAPDAKGRKSIVLYLSQGDNLPRQAELNFVDGADKVSYVVTTKNIALGTSATGSDAYAFKAPEGSREMTLEEMTADKWYTDLEEAKKVAGRTNRLLLVDFYADW